MNGKNFINKKNREFKMKSDYDHIVECYSEGNYVDTTTLHFSAALAAEEEGFELEDLKQVQKDLGPDWSIKYVSREGLGLSDDDPDDYDDYDDSIY